MTICATHTYRPHMHITCISHACHMHICTCTIHAKHACIYVQYTCTFHICCKGSSLPSPPGLNWTSSSWLWPGTCSYQEKISARKRSRALGQDYETGVSLAEPWLCQAVVVSVNRGMTSVNGHGVLRKKMWSVSLCWWWRGDDGRKQSLSWHELQIHLDHC